MTVGNSRTRGYRYRKQESLGFSQAKLVFGRNVHDPSKVLKDQLMSSSPRTTSVNDFIVQCKNRWQRASMLARRFDQKAVSTW